ncbi:MAG: carboxymuconolactone decarboxylase family protein [Pirellulales bacterium]
MTRIQTVAPEQATGKAKELLNAVNGKLGLVPNMMRAMANAPAVLDAYLAFSSSLGKGSLSPKQREQIALTVAQRNGCDYCLAAHSAIGKMVGLTEEQIRDSRQSNAIDTATDVVLKLADRLVVNQGRLNDADWTGLRSAGMDDATIAEVVANVALNIFTNYFNHVAETEVDFPKATPLPVESQSCSSQGTCCSTHS